MENDNNEGIRLQLRLARAGIASRRKCEEYIAEGRVTVNGEIVMTPGTKVTDDDDVRFDGARVRDEKKKVYIALHKPAGFLCSDEDPDGRPLAKSLLDVVVKERIFHVGRLDYMTSGLIFYTNDGDFARALTHPSKKIDKEYVVTTKSAIPDELMERFLKGITVEGVRYKASEAELTGPRTARIVLTEGKNRELRRVFLSMAVSIKKVHRVRIGTVRVKGIDSGHFRYLKDHEVKALLEGLKPRGGSFAENRRGRAGGRAKSGFSKTGSGRESSSREKGSRTGRDSGGPTGNAARRAGGSTRGTETNSRAGRSGGYSKDSGFRGQSRSGNRGPASHGSRGPAKGGSGKGRK